MSNKEQAIDALWRQCSSAVAGTPTMDQDDFIRAVGRSVNAAVQNIYADTYQAMWREVGLELPRDKAMALACSDTHAPRQ